MMPASVPLARARLPRASPLPPDGGARRPGPGAGPAWAPPGPSALRELSPREREIARLVAKGLVNKTIAGVLEISPWTVATHLRRMFAKLNVTSRASMVAVIYGNERLDDPPLGV